MAQTAMKKDNRWQKDGIFATSKSIIILTSKISTQLKSQAPKTISKLSQGSKG